MKPTDNALFSQIPSCAFVMIQESTTGILPFCRGGEGLLHSLSPREIAFSGGLNGVLRSDRVGGWWLVVMGRGSPARSPVPVPALQWWPARAAPPRRQRQRREAGSGKREEASVPAGTAGPREKGEGRTPGGSSPASATSAQYRTRRTQHAAAVRGRNRWSPVAVQ
jgi:hypothetical protein